MSRRFVVSLALVGLLSMPRALACTCITSGTPEQNMPAFDLVFVGEVVQTDLVGVNAADSYLTDPRFDPASNVTVRLVMVRVREVWKGKILPYMILSTAPNGAGCGYSFEAGKSYLIFAQAGESTNGKYGTNRMSAEVSLCSPTRVVEGPDELNRLRPAAIKAALPSWTNPKR